MIMKDINEQIRFWAHMLDEAMDDKVACETDNEQSNDQKTDEELEEIRKHFIKDFDKIVDDVIDEYSKSNSYAKRQEYAAALKEYIGDMYEDIVDDAVYGYDVDTDELFKNYLKRNIDDYDQMLHDEHSDLFTDDGDYDMEREWQEIAADHQIDHDEN